MEINSWTWPAAASDWAAQERERFDEHGVGVSAVGAWGVDPLGDGAAEERAAETVAGQLLPADRPSAFGYPVC